MNAELERKFFETFDIEPIGCKDNKNCNGTLDCRTQCPNAKYPTITDTQYLELIKLGLNYDFVIRSKSVEELKEKLLALLIYNEAEFKPQVQELFKGE